MNKGKIPLEQGRVHSEMVLDLADCFKSLVNDQLQEGRGTYPNHSDSIKARIRSREITDLYLQYQEKMVEGWVLSQRRSKRQRILLFGASSLGERHCVLLNSRNREIAFVDNDSRKWGTVFCGRPVYSVGDLDMKRWDRVFITSVHVVDIMDQLMAIDMITDLAQVMPNLGKTALEREFRLGFEALIQWKRS